MWQRHAGWAKNVNALGANSNTTWLDLFFVVDFPFVEEIRYTAPVFRRYIYFIFLFAAILCTHYSALEAFGDYVPYEFAFYTLHI